MTPILASTPALWYFARGSGVVSLGLLTLTVILGVTASTRWATQRWPRPVVNGLHRNLSLLSVTFLAMHVSSVVVDGYVPIRWLDAVVPFGSSYHPFWLGLGATAFDVLIALVVTSLLRVRLGHGVWRAVHWAAYACWPLALLHGLGVGSDRRQGWLLLLDGLAVCAVAAAVWWRLAVGQVRPAASQLAPGTGSSHARPR